MDKPDVEQILKTLAQDLEQKVNEVLDQALEDYERLPPNLKAVVKEWKRASHDLIAAQVKHAVAT